MDGNGGRSNGTDIQSGVIVDRHTFGGQSLVQTLVGISFVVSDNVGLVESIETAPFFFRVFAAGSEQLAEGN